MNKKTILAMLLTLAFAGAGCASSGTDLSVDTPESASPDLSELTVPGASDAPSEVTESPAMADGGGEVAERPPVPTEPVGILPADRIENKRVRIATAKGDIVFELYSDDAPKTVSNFVALAESGYFDGLTFHRVVPGFVVQGGDPAGNGTGGPGYEFEDEPVTRDYDAGIVAMANRGPDTNGSQFFVCLEDQPSLPKNYTIFGMVTEGMEVVREIAIGDRMTSVLIEDVE